MYHRFRCSSIKSNSIICTCNIKINCSRKSDSINSLCCKLLCTSERTISTDYNYTVNSMLSAYFSTSLLTFFSHEFHASCCIEDCSTTLDNISNASLVHINYLIIKKSVIALLNTLDLKSLIQSSSYNCTDSSIHAWSISTTC